MRALSACSRGFCLTTVLLSLVFRLFPPSDASVFQDLPYKELNIRSFNLKSPFAIVSSAKEVYDLKEAQEGDQFCSPTIIRITDRGSISQDRLRPQVIISGAIHGDERVGPHASLFLSELLVWSALCEIHKSEKHCDLLDMHEISFHERIWLAFLSTRRDTFVLPAANCLGYMNNKREDAGEDPNRDFPYSRKDTKCLRSSTSKLFQRVMSSNLIQIVVTFHGGMVAIGYEWGSNNHPSPNDGSPDDVANSEIGTQLVSYSGAFREEKLYPIGRINSLVYPVDGGMEDWMYAAGWDQALVKSCEGHPLLSNKTAGNSKDKVGNRAIVFLVETSDQKRPSDESLGGSKKPLDVRSEHSGHVSRNVRLALVTIDIAMPYNCFKSIGIEETSTNTTIRFLANNEKNKQTKIPQFEQISKQRKSVEDDGNSTIDESQKPAVIADPPLVIVNSTVGTSDSASSSISSDYTSKTEIVMKEVKYTEIALEWYIGGSVTVDATWLSIHIPSPQHSFPLTNTSSSSSSTPTPATPASPVYSGDNWTNILENISRPKTIPYPPQSPLVPLDPQSTPTNSRTRKTLKNEKTKKRKKSRGLGEDIYKKLGSDKVSAEPSDHEGELKPKETYPVYNKVTKSGGKKDGKKDFNGDSDTNTNNVNLKDISRKDNKFPLPVSYAQKGEGKWAPGKDPHRPQIFSAVVRLSLENKGNKIINNMKKLSDNNEKTDSNGNNDRIYDINGVIYLPPGVYHLVAWSKVDTNWGKKNQGIGSEIPESYLANGRTNPDWKSKLPDNYSKKVLGKNNLRTTQSPVNEKINNERREYENGNNVRKEFDNVNAKEEYERIKGRVVEGRDMWPSDPIVIEITKSGKVILLSSVLRCAWWDRKIVNNISNENSNFDGSNSSKNNKNDNNQLDNDLIANNNDFLPVKNDKNGDSMDGSSTDIDSNPSNDLESSSGSFSYISQNFGFSSKNRNFYLLFCLTVVFCFAFIAVRNFRQCFLSFGNARRRENPQQYLRLRQSRG